MVFRLEVKLLPGVSRGKQKLKDRNFGARNQLLWLIDDVPAEITMARPSDPVIQALHQSNISR